MTKRQKWLLAAGIGLMGCATAAGVQLVRSHTGPRVEMDAQGLPRSCIKDVVLGMYHTCILFQNGRVHCFGNDFSTGTGELDLEPPLDEHPVRTDERFTSLAAQQGDTCGISRKDASVWCWGKSTKESYGQSTPTSLPLRFEGLSTDNVQVAPASDRVFSVKRDGSLWFQRFGPHPAERVLEGVREVAAGNYSACAKMRDETVQCWGNNDGGQLGRGTMGNAGLGVWAEPPALIVGEGREFQTLRVQGGVACGITKSHEVWCWGYADLSAFADGRYDNGTNGFELVVSRPTKLTLPLKLKDYQLFGVALAEDGSIWSWGPADSNPLLKNTVVVPRERLKLSLAFYPEKLEQLGTDNARILVYAHHCVMKNDASVWCWGDNRGGQVVRKKGDTAGLHQLPVVCAAD